MKKFDYLIVGAGLAGCFLSFELRKRGLSVFIIDAGIKHRASAVAAGILNPFPGRNFSPLFKLDETFPAALNAIAEIEDCLGCKLLHCVPQIRIFQDQQEMSRCQARREMPEYAHYFESTIEAGVINGFDAPLGGVKIVGGGYLDTVKLTNAIEELFRAEQSYINAPLVYDDIRVDDHAVCWNDMAFSGVIFCEGWQASRNPWFSKLPFKHAKGEILTLGQVSLEDSSIINRGHWLLPLDDGNCKIGATVDWENLDLEADHSARDELLAAFPELALKEVAIVNQEVGIRPSSHDTLPYLGVHPRVSGIYLFNGLGGKGAVLAPWCAQKLADLLEDGISLPAEVDLQRAWG